MERFKREDAPPVEGLSLASHSRLRSASRPDGEHGAKRFAMIREVLLRYLSPVLVESVLTRALATRGLTHASLTTDQLSEVTADVMVGLRMFVPDTQLPQLMLDLAEALESRA